MSTFSIQRRENGDLAIAGWLDASHAEEAGEVFDTLTTTTRVDLKELEYISSMGLGLLLKAQKRLGSSGHALILANTGKMVRDVFRIARFDLIFKFED
jgi:anti-anti-sigma factor